MTDQPPPPPGNYPPPPPPPGGYPPPPPQVAVIRRLRRRVAVSRRHRPSEATRRPPPRAWHCRQEAYTPWLTRVLAWIIDYIPVLIIEGIGFGLLLGTQETACITDTSEYDLGEFCATGASTIGQVSFVVFGDHIALAYVVWNLGYRQGTTGSSIGKSIMKFKIVSEKTGQPIGFGMSIRARAYLPSGFFGLRHPLARRRPVPAVGSQATDAGRQNHQPRSPCRSRHRRTLWKVT